MLRHTIRISEISNRQSNEMALTNTPTSELLPAEYLVECGEQAYEEPDVLHSYSPLVIDPFDARIKSMDVVKEPTPYKVGQITTRRIVMTDGTEYLTKTGEPIERTTDVSEAMTTALFTRIGGINKRMMLAVLGEGRPVNFISTELRFRQLGIGRSGHNMLQIVRALQEEHEQEPDVTSYSGISQAGMKGMAFKALSPANGMNVLYSDLIVTCFNEGLSLKLIREMRRQPGNELDALRRHLGGIALPYLLKYRKTVDLSWQGIHSGVRSIPVLISDETGHWGRLINRKNAMMHLRNLPGDIMSQGEKWAADFEDYPGVVVDNSMPTQSQHGGHLDCISEEIYQEWLTRQRGLRDELVRVDDNVKAIDFKNVHLAEAA